MVVGRGKREIDESVQAGGERGRERERRRSGMEDGQGLEAEQFTSRRRIIR